MLYEDRMDAAKAILVEYNRTVGVGVLNEEEFTARVKSFGGITVGALKHCTWEDLEERLHLPPLVCRQIAVIFRANEPQRFSFICESRAKTMSVTELLAFYDPQKPDNAIGNRLRRLINDKKCIVFDECDRVNTVASKSIIEEIKDGFAKPSEWMLDGIAYKTYAIGEHPSQFVEENPLYPGVLLRQDETCDITLRSWRGISNEVRLIVYLAVTESHELYLPVTADAIKIMDKIDEAFKEGGYSAAEEMVATLFKKAAELLQHKKRGQTVPKLRKRKAN